MHKSKCNLEQCVFAFRPIYAIWFSISIQYHYMFASKKLWSASNCYCQWSISTHTIVLSFDQIWIQDVFPHSLIVWSFCKAPFQGLAGTNPTQKSMLSWLGFFDINIINDRFQNRRKLMLIKKDLVICTLQVSFATPSPWCRHVVYQQAKKLIPFALWLTIRGRTCSWRCAHVLPRTT